MTPPGPAPTFWTRAPSGTARTSGRHCCGLGERELHAAVRVARGRERLGVHYPSDSAASRKLAAGVWARCRPGDAGEAPLLQVPSLQRIWALVEAEWPTLQPNDAVLAPAAAPAMPHQARG